MSLLGDFMSKLIKTLAVLFVGTMVAKSAIFPPQVGFNTYYSNLLSFATNSLTTNAVTVTNFVEMNLYHTLQYGLTTNGVTNSVTFIADTSLDSTNWVHQGTNSIAATGGTDYLTVVGKWRFIRVRAGNTGGAGSVQYLGGR